MNKPIFRLDSRDPKCCLSDAARVRIDDARFEGDTLRARVESMLLMQYKSDPELDVDFGTYLASGQAAIEHHKARLEFARIVLLAEAKEFWDFGKSLREVDAILSESVEGAVRSLDLTILDRDLLRMEISQLLRKLNSKSPEDQLPSLTSQQIDLAEAPSADNAKSSTAESRSRFQFAAGVSEEHRHWVRVLEEYRGRKGFTIPELVEPIRGLCREDYSYWRKHGKGKTPGHERDLIKLAQSILARRE